MNLQEWRAKQAQASEQTLPSGLTVALRKVDVMDLATSGAIPSSLSAAVTESLTTGKQITPSLADLPSMRTIFVAVAKAAVVEPADLDVARELPFNDLFFIFNWCNGEAAALKPFRDGETEPVGT